MKKLAGSILLVCAVFLSTGVAADDPSSQLELRAMIDAMSPEEKIGQLALRRRGSRGSYDRPSQELVDAGAASVMTAFNEVNGIPASAHHELLTQILRDEWGCDGFVVSDWSSVTEMVAHGTSADTRDAARQALSAGLDQEMMSRSFEDHLGELVVISRSRSVARASPRLEV